MAFHRLSFAIGYAVIRLQNSPAAILQS